MFNKLKHHFSANGKRVAALLIAAALCCGLAGCSKKETSAPASGTSNQTGFDLEVVRKSLMVRGVPLELPKRIGDLDSKWTYQKLNASYVDGTGMADFYYDGKEMFIGGVRDFEGSKEENGVIFDVALETSDCSIGGITPNVSTKADVLKKYGEPVEINVVEERGLYRYVYGIREHNQVPFVIEHSQMFTVVFYIDTDVVQGVRVVYSDLRD